MEELQKIKENIQNAQKTIDNLNLSLSLSLSLMRKKQRLEDWEKLPPLNMDMIHPPTPMESLGS